MKKTYIKQLSFVAVIVFFTCCSTGPEVNKKMLAAVRDEVKLNICQSVIEPYQANITVPQSYLWIRANAKRFQDLEFEISMPNLYNLRDNIRTQVPDSCTNYATGLKVYYGLKDSTLHLLFRPAYMYNQASTNEFRVVLTDTFMVYTSSGFQLADSADIASLNTYTTNVRFREAPGVIRNFKNASDSTGDVRSVLLPFQEIEAVMEQNNKQALVLWNYALQLPADYINGRIRHTLLLAPEGLTPILLDAIANKKILSKLRLFGAFTGNFADRCHICPPACEEVTMKRAVAGFTNCQEP